MRPNRVAFLQNLPLRKHLINVSSNGFLASPDALAAWLCGGAMLLSREPGARSVEAFENQFARPLWPRAC